MEGGTVGQEREMGEGRGNKEELTLVSETSHMHHYQRKNLMLK